MGLSPVALGGSVLISIPCAGFYPPCLTYPTSLLTPWELSLMNSLHMKPCLRQAQTEMQTLAISLLPSSWAWCWSLRGHLQPTGPS